MVPSANQTAWKSCGHGDFHPLDATTATGKTNYCGVTNASAIPFTDEDLALFEGLKRTPPPHCAVLCPVHLFIVDSWIFNWSGNNAFLRA